MAKTNVAEITGRPLRDKAAEELAHDVAAVSAHIESLLNDFPYQTTEFGPGVSGEKARAELWTAKELLQEAAALVGRSVPESYRSADTKAGVGNEVIVPATGTTEIRSRWLRSREALPPYGIIEERIEDQRTRLWRVKNLVGVTRAQLDEGADGGEVNFRDCAGTLECAVEELCAVIDALESLNLSKPEGAA